MQQSEPGQRFQTLKNQFFAIDRAFGLALNGIGKIIQSK